MSLRSEGHELSLGFLFVVPKVPSVSVLLAVILEAHNCILYLWLW